MDKTKQNQELSKNPSRRDFIRKATLAVSAVGVA
jgi:hypothetical protein